MSTPMSTLVKSLSRRPALRQLVARHPALKRLACRLAPDLVAEPPRTPGPVRPNAQQRADIAKARDVVAAMLAAGQDLRRRPVLMEHLKRFGLAMNNWPDLAPWQDWYNSSTFGVLQTPSEYVDYLLYAADKNPKSCLEIGVYTGGLAVFSCAFFQALDPQFRYVGIDIHDGLVIDPALVRPLNLEFRIPCSSREVAGQVFDLVFIDGDHSYGWAKRDWLNVGRHARLLCAFHDIHGKEYLPRGGGVFTFWRQLRASQSREVTMVEFTHAPPGSGKDGDGLWMGIGVLDHSRG